MNEKVSIIIPFRDVLPVTKECIESAKNQSYNNLEIITISDKVDLKEAGITHVKLDKSCGPGTKRNAGVKKATGEILFFLDSDCILKKDTIKELIDIFNTTKADAVSGKPLAPRHGNLLCYVTGLEYEQRFDEMGENWVSIAATTCFGVKKKAFFALKGFTDYTTGEATGEDWDFSKRLTLKGYKIFHTNKVEVVHEHGSDSLSKYLYRRYMHARYRPVHYKKHKQAFDEYMTRKAFIKMTLLLSIPQTIAIFKRTKEPAIFLLPFLSVLRNFAWALGLAVGTIFN